MMKQPWRLFAIVCLVVAVGLAVAPTAGVPSARAQSGCVQLIQNGGFEDASAWLLGIAPQIPEYVTHTKHSGNRSLALGIIKGGSQLSYSSARQMVSIPPNADATMLTFWFYAMMTAPIRSQIMELVLLAPDGSTLAKPWFSQNDSRVWNQMSVDLTRWRGRTLQVYFNVYNDGQGGTAGMFLDDVSLVACSNGTPLPTSTVTPPTPTPTPSLTAPVPIWTSTNTPYYITPTSGPIVATPTWTPYYITPTPGPFVATPTWTPYYWTPTPYYWTPTPYYWTPTPYYWTPTPYYWTPTPGPYPTVSPYPLTPWPSNCIDLVKNGAFDYGFSGWFAAANKLPAYLVGNPVISPPYAMHLGTQGQQIKSYSSVRQYVTIPAGTHATLQFWTWTWAEPNAGADHQEAVLLSSNDTVLAVLWRVLANEQNWRQVAIDLTPYAGRSVAIYFNAYNDGVGGRTALILDNVQLLACGNIYPPPGPVTVLPPIAVGTPSVLPELSEAPELSAVPGEPVAEEPVPGDVYSPWETDTTGPVATSRPGPSTLRRTRTPSVSRATTSSASTAARATALAAATAELSGAISETLTSTLGVNALGASNTATASPTATALSPQPAMTYVTISRAPPASPTPRPAATLTSIPTATATPQPPPLQQWWNNATSQMSSPNALLGYLFGGLIVLVIVVLFVRYFVFDHRRSHTP